MDAEFFSGSAPLTMLCTPCAEKLKAEATVKRVAGGRDNKITCACCKRRRFGATYAISKGKA